MDLFGTATAQFDAEPVGTGTITGKLGKCILPDFVTLKGPQKLTLTLGGFSKTNGTITDASGDVIFTYEIAMAMGVRGMSIFFKDKSGSVIAMVKVKDGMTGSSFRVMRLTPAYKGQPEEAASDGTVMYPFAKGDVGKGLGVSSVSYSVIKGDEEGQPVAIPLYTAKKGALTHGPFLQLLPHG